MARLNKRDLEQMGEDYFHHLEYGVLVEVAENLHELAIEQLEKLEETSKTSSRPPSSDNPYLKPWTFLVEVIRLRRKGLPAPSIPLSLQAA